MGEISFGRHLVIVLAGPWMMDLMTVYTVNLFESIATVVREN